jgi:hypothetical protein
VARGATVAVRLVGLGSRGEAWRVVAVDAESRAAE